MTQAPVFQTIGKPIPRVEGPDKVTGRARYAADFVPPHTLWAKNVRSPHPHARIVSIDRSRALRVPGVRAILTAADVPLKRTGRALKDLPILCSDRVRYAGDKVAVVAADDPEAAEDAALQVVLEYEELPAVFDPVAAMQPGAPVIHPDARSYTGFFPGIPAHLPNVCGYRVHHQGDISQGLAAADLVVEHTFFTHLTHQGYIEPHACVVGMGAGGRVEVWASHKLPYVLREQLAELIDVPESHVVIETVTVGGDFGSKGAPFDVPAAYHLARLTGRPVKFVASSPEDLVAMSHRHPSVVTVRTGVRRDGTIIARDVRVIYNTGAYGALKPSEDGMLTGADYAAGPYEIPHLRIEAFCVYTNQPPCGYMRGPGHPQVAFAVEAHSDLVARELGMDPLEFRLRNAVRRSPSGGESLAPRALQAAADAIGWTPNPKPETRNLLGRGVAMVMRGVGFGEGSLDLTLHPDGTITVLSALPDNGTGALTVVAQIVAEVLGAPMERVRLVRGTTDSLPIDVGSAADRMTNVAGHTAIATAEKLKEQLVPLAASMLGVEDVRWERDGWRAADGRRLSLEELAAEMVTPGHPAAHAQVTLAQPRSPERACCVQAAEVEVDSETGEVHVSKLATVQEVGTIINAQGHQGQIEGGIVQGIGYALSEELAIEEGQTLNANFADYKVPTARDIPPLITVNVPSSGPGPFNATGIGEMPCVPVAGAIANAVADAIGAPLFQLPITAERVLAALDAKRRQ